MELHKVKFKHRCIEGPFWNFFCSIIRINNTSSPSSSNLLKFILRTIQDKGCDSVLKASGKIIAVGILHCLQNTTLRTNSILFLVMSYLLTQGLRACYSLDLECSSLRSPYALFSFFMPQPQLTCSERLSLTIRSKLNLWSYLACLQARQESRNPVLLTHSIAQSLAQLLQHIKMPLNEEGATSL